MFVFPQILDLFWIGRRARGGAPGQDRLVPASSRDRPAPADGGPPPDLPEHRSRQARRGVCGSSSRAGAFLPPASSRPGRTSASWSCRATARPRRDREPCNSWQDHPLGTVGRPTGRRRDADRGGWRDPVPRPDRHQRVLAGPGGDGGGLHGGRLLQDGRPGPPRPAGPPRPPRPQARHDRPAQQPQRLPGGHRERPADRRDPGLGRARDRARANRGDRPGPGAARASPGGRLGGTGRRGVRAGVRPRRGCVPTSTPR